MSALRFGWAITITICAICIAACAGPSPSAEGSLSSIAPDRIHASAVRISSLVSKAVAIAVHPDERTSWIKPDAKHQRLIYVSDVATDDVNMYSYKTGALVGQLTGFNEPQGICSDSKGNVYISNTLASDVVEYAHAGTVPIQVLNDPGQFPVDCTIIAYEQVVAANITTSTGGPGSLSFLGPSGSETVTAPWLSKMFSIAYLAGSARYEFMTVTTKSGKVSYAKEQFGNFHRVETPVNAPGAVRFSGIHKYMAVGDQSGNIYLVQGKTVISKTKLGSLCSAAQFSISQTDIVMPDPCGAQVLIYPFPRGRQPSIKITDRLTEPVGTAISVNDLRGP